MAITYAAKLGESTTAGATTTITTASAAKAGSLIVVAFGGKAAASLTASSVSDGTNTYTRHQRASTSAAVGIAWFRLANELASGSTITVTWSSTPTVAWVSAHAFEGASGTNTDTDTLTGSSATASATVNVSGSDWLTVAVVGLPSDFDAQNQVGANSSTIRDSNGRTTAAPWLEMVSRNGTSGTTHSPGVTYQISVTWYAVAVSWPYLAMPSSSQRSQNTALWGV